MRQSRQNRPQPSTRKFGNWVIDPAFFTRLVYEGV